MTDERNGADLDRLAEQAIDAARAEGAEAADVLAVASDGLSMEIREGRLEQAERAEGVELGLRVLVGRRQACVSVSDMRAAGIRAMAERAVAMAREAPEDPTVGLAAPQALARDWDLAALDLDDPAAAPRADALAEAARAMEAAALGVDGVAQVSTAGASWGRTRVHLLATNGFSGGYARTSHSLGCVAIGGEGLAMERDYAVESRVHGADLPTPEEIGRRAGTRTAARAGARQPKTGAYPVLFDERIAAGLIGHLLSAVNGTAIARGTSWLKGAMGEAVLPAGHGLLEEPHRPRVTGSRPFDAEGLATAARPLVEDGRLLRWILDLGTARKLGLESTANATRGPGGPPAPASGNIRLTGPQTPRDRLLAEMGEGLLVTSLMGASINPNTGDYSRGASGFWVRGGQIAEPVNECTIAGNLRQMLATIRAADDARPYLGRVVPSLLVEGLTVAGG